MKKFIFVTALLFLIAVSPSSADELKIKGYIKSDPLRGGNNYLIYNKDGNATGRISPDPIRPSSSSHYLIYDKNGNPNGKIRPDYLDKRRYIIEKAKND